MEDIPQPPPKPYNPGDYVRVCLDPDDPDSKHHGVDGVVVERSEDSMHRETGRDLDKYSYTIRQVGEKDLFGVEFRHFDLVPID